MTEKANEQLQRKLSLEQDNFLLDMNSLCVRNYEF